MRDTELQINLSNLSHNLNILKENTTSEIQGVLKAFSYGLEINEVVEVIDEHVSCYSVMSIDEAILVRNKSSKPILLLQGIYDLDEYKEVLKYDLDFVIHSDWQLKNLEEGLKNHRLWLKLNTGLNRLGFNAEKFESTIKVLEQKGFINLVLMSHFACADEKGHPLNDKQLQLFEKVTKKFSYKKSLANSGAVFNYPESHYDIVRPGISVYGGGFYEHGIKPVTNFRSKIISIRNVKKGDSVGYEASWTADKDSLVAVISLGYADGYPLIYKDVPVFVNDKQFHTIGRTSMDMVCVNLGDDSSIKVGDWVEMWNFKTPLNTLAKSINTISYQLLTNISRRVPKNYLE